MKTFFIFTLLLSISLPGVTGHHSLANRVSIDSKYMNEKRMVFVRLPKNYEANNDEKNPAKRYPVVYQLQSQDTFLAAASAIDNLNASGQMPEVILVGIEHKNKFSELNKNAPEYQMFSKHLIEEIKPFIEANYRTADFSMLSGWSVGGGFVIDKMINKAPFNAFFAYSPGLSVEIDIARYKKSLKKTIDTNKFLIISLGNEQGDFINSFEILTRPFSEIDTKQNLHFKTHPDFDHRGNALISQYYGFKKLFSGWTPSDELTLSGLEALKDHYTTLSKTYGFNVKIPKEILLFSTYSILSTYAKLNSTKDDNLKNGTDLIRYTVKNHPETRQAFIEMSEHFLNQQSTAQHDVIKRALL